MKFRLGPLHRRLPQRAFLPEMSCIVYKEYYDKLIIASLHLSVC
jgi:hypothetical protein